MAHKFDMTLYEVHQTWVIQRSISCLYYMWEYKLSNMQWTYVMKSCVYKTFLTWGIFYFPFIFI